MRGALRLCLAVALATVISGCGKPDFSDAEKDTIASLSLSALPPLREDSTNRYDNDADAAALGSIWFFDQGLSGDGTVSCATCHKPDRQFQDDLPQAAAIGNGNRRTMPLAGVARDPWFFWDGRRDSLWAQALVPLEDPREHAGNRTAYAHFVKVRYGDRYERLFGPLPDLSGVPADASPLGSAAERAVWNAMTAVQRDGVNRVFANIGKAIAAFERSIEPQPSRFDRFADALAGGATVDDATFTGQEIQGLKLFIGKANCVTCHNGPRFTDHDFHHTGVPPLDGFPIDRGRVVGSALVAADPFNCFGRYRDGGEDACGELRFMRTDGPELIRGYKTPSLRGAADRPPYMHAGQLASLEEVVAHYADAPTSVEGENEIHPVQLSERERAALVAFLKTLADRVSGP
jgi:cytochrome c peroxidase